MIIVDDDDERLSLTASGFRAEVIPEDADDEWRTLSGADELVEFYDPTDVFGDLADALAEAFPAVAPELADATNGTGGGDEVAADGARRGARATADADAPTPRPTPPTPRTSRPRDDAARRRGAGRQPGDPAGPVAPGVSRPGHRGRVARRPVRPRPAGRLLRDHPAPPVLAQHGRSGDRHGDRPFPGHRPWDGLVHPAAAGRRDRPARAARPAVRGRPAQPPPAARRRRARDRRRADARRRGDPRRSPGHAPVRGGVGARGLSVEPPAR